MKKVILGVLSLILITSGSLFAQTWTLQSVPTNTGVNGAWAVNANVVWMSGPGSYVIRTTNGGSTWALANTGIAGDIYTIAAVSDQIAIAGAGDGAIWRTTNGGANWNFQVLTPVPVFIDVVHMFDANNGFALSDPTAAAGLWLYYITTNGGVNWTVGANRPPNAASEAGFNGSYCALDTGNIWWGTNSSKIWHGGFRGPFTSATTTQNFTYGIGFNDALTGLSSGATSTNTVTPVIKTTNGGTSWANTSYTPIFWAAFGLKYVPGTGYAWLGAQNIYRSTDFGTTWVSQLTLPNTNVPSCFTMLNVNTGWCGTSSPTGAGTAGQVYVYHDVVGIDPNNTSIPKSYSLDQNFPNPFNPTTNIRYSIPKASQVSIKVYDALGNEVRTVVNEYKNVGNYVESFDASNLASGIYFYTIRAADYVQTKKMSLIK